MHQGRFVLFLEVNGVMANHPVDQRVGSCPVATARVEHLPVRGGRGQQAVAADEIEF